MARDYEDLRKAEAAEAEKLRLPPASSIDKSRDYGPLRQMHEAPPSPKIPEKKRTPLEEAEWAIELDQKKIAEMRAFGRHSSGDIAHKERDLQSEPLDRKIERYKRAESYRKELEASDRYLASLPKPVKGHYPPAPVEDAMEHPNREVTDKRSRELARAHNQLARYRQKDRKPEGNSNSRGGHGR